MTIRRVLSAILVLVIGGITHSAWAQHEAKPVSVVATFPHDSDAFTQGFDFLGRALYEGTGLYGESTLRRVDLDSGEVLRKRSLDEKYFGEGITVVGKRIFQLTWKENVAFVYRRRTFKRIRRFRYRGEGWGLTHNRKRLVMSNGSDRIVFRDLQTFRITRRITVTDEGEPVTRLNELEWYRGDILANVWQTDHIVRIDPKNGDVVSRYDLAQLKSREEQEGDPDVTNGIAYLGGQDRLFVTGKRWAHVYEIELPD